MKTNSAQYAAYMELVENQIRDSNPRETKQTFERLKREGISEYDAKIHIIRAIARETLWIMKNSEPFNLQRFIKNLIQLPADPKD